ncbi:MBOAT family protein [Dissulfurirhabdus thermomarina]|uniref:MBOAT family protein n=1 Tax=Dissulfurirhabdus thermomarina TaxID=1765737 RepID=A0A6N9TQM8_DISTH|nr:MBOAT family protein [Dissulfurirhabdus thermomarina]NDY42413.1 MBOAT family protein [Dissulfurirhabdus thermomarina]NMX23817.1 MBOAT family protein [Dissulfurirhabdus thermomarina]
MLFNSYEYIFLFLPVVVAVYFALNRRRLVAAGKAWLVLASLFFYSYWNIRYLPLLLLSILVNYAVGTALATTRRQRAPWEALVPPRLVLAAGICFNVGLLGYFKYTDFFLDNLNRALGLHLPLPHIALPLAISFFTFQQIAFLVDSYRGETAEYDFLDYCLFVSFFPQLIAGPIVHHGEMMPQFSRIRNKLPNHRNIAIGLAFFAMGLFKKAVIADTLSEWATQGFDTAPVLNLAEAWTASLAYTFQLYYDFSGYTDMAMGAAYLFNIRLPLNFNSPYKAGNIRDFWRRWHMTLTRWLRDYLYIPMGGNRRGVLRGYVNLVVTFFLVGLWHGAGWTYVLWGTLHGLGSAVHRLWRNAGLRMPTWIGWPLTFLFVHCTWVVFRARNLHDAAKVFKGMLGMTGVVLPAELAPALGRLAELGVRFGETFDWVKGNARALAILALVAAMAFAARNSVAVARELRPDWKSAAFVTALLVLGVLHLSQMSEFLYFIF